MTSLLDFDTLTTPQNLVVVAVGMTVFWAFVMEASKKAIFNALPSQPWWSRAIAPTRSMMQNFGFPKEPTDQFPKAVTDEMAQDFYAFLTTLCVQHFLSAVPMVPVVYYGWNDSPEVYKSLFVLGTLSDVGFDVYDAIKTTIRTFTNHRDPIPIDFWVVIVAMHHTMALALVIPMDVYHVDRWEFHQAGVSLLMAAALCYGAGCYKFALDIKKYGNFLMYKFIMVFQLAVILYTRVYLWFPAAKSILLYFKESGDSNFYYGSCLMLTIFSLFNLLLVADGVKGVANWLPKAFPKTTEEKKSVETLRLRTSMVMPMPTEAFEIAARMHRRRKFKGAVRTVMASNRLKKMSTSMASDKKE